VIQKDCNILQHNITVSVSLHRILRHFKLKAFHLEHPLTLTPFHPPRVCVCSRCRSYRLAPEAVFPDQYYDALAASRAFLSPEVARRYGLDPERLCVSGDSAGGNLAAAVAQEVSSHIYKD